MEFSPKHFIDEKITVEFNQPPAFEKTPPCPQRFHWKEQVYSIETLLAEWSDFSRKGRMARTMSPTHALTASERGSLGVGRFFFRVQTQSEQIFDIYYDRMIQDTDRRKGQWFLWREMETKHEQK